MYNVLAILNGNENLAIYRRCVHCQCGISALRGRAIPSRMQRDSDASDGNTANRQPRKAFPHSSSSHHDATAVSF